MPGPSEKERDIVTEFISEWAVRFLDGAGYWGASFLMMLESMVAPVPSEAVMPFVGFLVADGKWSAFLAILATSLGSIVGSLISYFMGYYGGKPLVYKVGKYLLLDKHDLEMTERFFNKRSGLLTLFISRFIPIIRHLISIPAGIGKMPLMPFILATLLGATIWNSFLLWLGIKLRENWGVVQKYSHQVDIGVIVLIVLFLTWFVYSRLRKRG
jgi:membrane protein DedA with SNARE-associated domain